MATSGSVTPPSSVNEGGFRILPEGGHEVPAILVLTVNGETHALGTAKDDLRHPANVMIRLGSKVSDKHPSSVGFRFLLQTDTPRPHAKYSVDDYYHVVSCRFDPVGGTIDHSKVLPAKKRELVEIHSFGREELRVESDQDLYQIDIHAANTDVFTFFNHERDLKTINEHVDKINKMIPFIVYATKLSLFFIADKLLIDSLTNIVERKCVGNAAPDWKSGLPDDAVTRWPANMQTQMVTGSTDVLNIALSASRDQPLRARNKSTDYVTLADGAGTAVQERLEAVKFKEHVRKTYPNARQEPENKVYPVMLNVPGIGNCIELPFGVSMLNRKNTYAGINALHALLDSQLPPSRIGLATLYPAQTQAYRDALGRCHKLLPSRGYNLVKCDILEDWVGKTVGIAIIDLVRSSNASGNLGYLSQANRLKVMLSLHENGFIVVGDRTCTATPNGDVTSTKLEKVLRWFEDHGRIVQISEKGYPCPNAPVATITSTTASVPLERAPSLDSTASFSRKTSVSTSDNNQPSRRYVGIPGLEHFKVNKPVNEFSRTHVGRYNENRDRGLANASKEKRGLPQNSTSPFKGKKKGHADDASSNVNTLNYDDPDDAAQPPDPYTSFLKQEIPSSLDTRSIAKSLNEALDRHASSMEKKRSETQNTLDIFGEEGSDANSQGASAATKAPPHETKSPSPLSQKLKPHEKTSSPNDLAPRQDSETPFRGPTTYGPFDENFGVPWRETLNKTPSQKGDSKLPTPAMYLANSSHKDSGVSIPPTATKKENIVPSRAIRTPSSQAAKLEDGIASRRVPGRMPENVAKMTASHPKKEAKDDSANKENEQLQNAAKTVPGPTPSIKIETASPEKPVSKIPPHKAVLEISNQGPVKTADPPIQSSSTTAAKAQSPVMESFPVLKPQPLVKESFPVLKPQPPVKESFPVLKPQPPVEESFPALEPQLPAKKSSVEPTGSRQAVPPGAADRATTSQAPSTAAKPTSETSSAAISNPDDSDEEPDFKTRNQPKYREIRARFARLDPKTPRAKLREDRLFRRLAEAMVDEDDDEFERIYTDLLGAWTKLQTGAIKRA